ncbi:RNA-binding domain-containing protein [Venturia nashicola]|uniref:RNA-binding domain-containing protein n=1 Tax=Venturia nashicola TaxID=86259 RepID=A0A4Z1P5G2_9PEZI|nr:RNA-binding domain-containing protein [Venturia nashicola]TLD30127.1 RNA-binding domain-containing protein [Venturia nashicola]
MASGARHWEQDKEATVYIGNLDERITDALVWELMLQAGRIVNVHLPKDRVNQSHQGYGFVEFISEEDADYAAKIMNQVRLYGKPIRVNKASADKQKSTEVGAELFIGNLDPMVDEKTLYDTFSRFGQVINAPKVARDDNNLSKGYGFVSFADFQSSDDAIANMNGQFLGGKEITVQYAYKKDGKGERHGDEAERKLADEAKKHNVQIASQPLPPGIFNQPPTPAAPPMAVPMAPQGYPPQGFNGIPPYAAPPQQAYQQRGAPPTGPASTPLPPAPAGLPQRPPPSMAGYGGPAEFVPPGAFQPPPGFAPPGAQPMRQNFPPGFAPPPGFGGR